MTWAYTNQPLARPWWEWATTPELESIVSRPDRQAAVRECPWCLDTVSYATGRFAHHCVEGTVPCRASRISSTVAMRIMYGIGKGKPVEWILEAFGDADRPPRRRDAGVEADAIMNEFSIRRQRLRIDITELAGRIDYSPAAVRLWEKGVANRVGLPAALSIASALATSLTLRREGVELSITTPEELKSALRGARKASGLTQTDVARSLGLRHETIREREKPRSALAMPLDTACQWAAAVGAELVATRETERSNA